MVFERCEDSATRFVGMRAVVETAVGRNGEDVAEIVRNLLRFHVESAEALDTRNVDQRSAFGKFEKFAERCGVHTRAVGVADVGRAGVGIRNEQIEQSGFSHARMAGQKCRAAFQLRSQRVGAFAAKGRNAMAGIADGGVDLFPIVECGLSVLLKAMHTSTR